MGNIYLPSNGPGDWQRLLADPVKHWRTGYSARTLAHAWEGAHGLPPEIASLFESDAQLLVALPEHKVPLPRGRDSQSDIFALIRSGGDTVAATIEGKVNESFAQLTSDWLVDASYGKHERLAYLCAMLGLLPDQVSGLRYQLLHRTASALIEAARFKTDRAAMIVHSFSQQRLWFDDFQRFAAAFAIDALPDQPHWITLPGGTPLMLAWATGHPDWLAS